MDYFVAVITVWISVVAGSCHASDRCHRTARLNRPHCLGSRLSDIYVRKDCWWSVDSGLEAPRARCPGEALYTGERGYLAVSVDWTDPTWIEEVSSCSYMCVRVRLVYITRKPPYINDLKLWHFLRLEGACDIVLVLTSCVSQFMSISPV